MARIFVEGTEVPAECTKDQVRVRLGRILWILRMERDKPSSLVRFVVLAGARALQGPHLYAHRTVSNELVFRTLSANESSAMVLLLSCE